MTKSFISRFTLTQLMLPALRKHKLLGAISFASLALLLSSCVVGSTLIFSERDVKDNPNLVENPGFDTYSEIPAEALKGWTVQLEPPTVKKNPVSIDTSASIEGSNSLKINASESSVLILSDSYTVRRYGGYYLRAQMKTDSPLPPVVQLRFIAFRDDGKIVNRFRKKSRLETDWHRFTISAGFIRPGAKFGRLGIFIPPFKEGSIWIDDLGCYEVHGFKID